MLFKLILGSFLCFWLYVCMYSYLCLRIARRMLELVSYSSLWTTIYQPNRFVTVADCIVSNFYHSFQFKVTSCCVGLPKKTRKAEMGKKATQELSETFIPNQQCSGTWNVKLTEKKPWEKAWFVNKYFIRARKDCEHHLQTSFFRPRTQR